MASKTGISVPAGKTIIGMIEDHLDRAIEAASDEMNHHVLTMDNDYDIGFVEGFHNGLAKALAILRNPYQDKQDETLDEIYANANARIAEREE